MQGNQFESSSFDTQSSFENLQDRETDESKVLSTKLKHNQESGKIFNKRNDSNQRKYKLPEKNLNYFRKQVKGKKNNSQSKTFKKPLYKQNQKGKTSYFSEQDRIAESSNSDTNLDRNDEEEFYDDFYGEEIKDDYSQYVDFVSQDTDSLDYNTEEDEFIEKNIETVYSDK